MLINKEIIQKLNPCDDRFNNYVNHYGKSNFTLEDFIVFENITYNDKVWVVTRLFTKEQNIKWSILCASKVLSIFENKYPNDKRPRLALEAAEAYLNHPSDENKNAVNAAYCATYVAASAAYCAINVAYATTAAAYAARAAASAAYAANATAYATESRNDEQTVNLILMLECI